MNKRNVQFLSKNEVRKIIDNIPITKHNPYTGYSYPDRYGYRDRALIEVLFSTGLRISEALALKVVDVVLEYKSGTKELTIVGKGDWQRTIYFSPSTMKIIYEWLEFKEDDTGFLFPFTPRTAQRMIKNRVKSAGMGSWITPHKFRHAFACNLLKKGVSLYYLKEFMGHRSLNSTQRYLHATNFELLEIHSKLME